FLLGHSPFLVLSDRLTRKGIIVLRYDDRGVANSTGDFSKATTQDFASDADAAVKYLMSRKDLNISEIGIAGHSEGGLIAPITATENKNVDFIVMLAGPGIPGDSILNLQGDLIAKASGFTDSMIYYYSAIRHDIINVVLAENDMDIISKKIIAINKEFLKTTPQYILDEMQMSAKDSTSAVDFYANVWTKYFLSFDPRPILEKLKIPVLALNGTNDLQVPYKENLMAIEEALKKSESKNYKVLELKGLNHLFQVSVSGSPNEYSSLEETFNEEAMEIIVNWILQL
ncbi:MAG: alpha/beta hydrolase, partial [Chitinophagales bacterium]|nr:alpha/beta hydrolase [Chitinophagales bacterium]